VDLQHYRQHIETVLERYLPQSKVQPERLSQAMRYAVLNGGKRLRALLVYAAGELSGAPEQRLDRIAAAIEMLHAYSLVHDDLPSMDNDDLRRGQATCHIAFDEATAILVGDALQSCAFALLAEPDGAAKRQLMMIAYLANAIGPQGMAGGQMLDLLAEGQSLKREDIETVHRLKTGKLFMACVYLGALAADDFNESDCVPLLIFAEKIGLAFQIQDDVLDIEASSETLGKTAGKDHLQEKATYPAIVGVAEAKQLICQLFDEACEALSTLNHDSSALRQLAAIMVQREY